MVQKSEETCSDYSYELVVEAAPEVDNEEAASVVVSDSEDTEATQVHRASDDDEIQGPANEANSKPGADDRNDTQTLKKDDTFFFGMVTIRVGDRLFRVPRDAFEKQSEYFKRRFSECPEASISGDVEGRLDLTGIEEDAFTDLLRLLYPPPRTSNFTGPVVLTREQWIKVLHLAQLWGFAGIRDIAIQELESSYSKQVDEVGKLEIALKYKIERWYMDAYLAMVKRKEPLSVEEGQRLGLELSLKLAQVREKRLVRKMQAAPTTLATSPSCISSHPIGGGDTNTGPGPGSASGVGFAPFAGAYLPFGTQASSSTAGSKASSATSKPALFEWDGPPFIAKRSKVSSKWGPARPLPSAKFGEPGFGFNTTTMPAAPNTPGLSSEKKPASSPPGGSSKETEMTPSVAASCSSVKKEHSQSDGAMNLLDYGYDDIQLRQDIKEIFGL